MLKMISKQVEYLEITPAPTPKSIHNYITEEELNQALLDFLKNVTTKVKL